MKDTNNQKIIIINKDPIFKNEGNKYIIDMKDKKYIKEPKKDKCGSP